MTQTRVTNKTQYHTADLRRFFRAGLRAMGAEDDKRILVAYSKRSIHWGCAYIGRGDRQGRGITMTIPKGKLDLLQLAQVFEHEVSHSLGLHHKDMAPDVADCKTNPTWHLGIEIRYSEPVNVKVDHVAKREEQARKMLDKWERRLRATQNRVKKWRAKVRYYDRKKAARKGK